jgi:hypothetical protein
MRDDLTQQLNDQLSSEMLVERIVMRTQGSRAEPPSRSVEGTASWSDEPPQRELTGGWPAIRLDEPQETRQFSELRRPEPARRDVPAPSPAARRNEQMPSWATESAAFDLFGPAEPYSGRSREDDRDDRAARPSRHAAEEAPAPRTQMSAVVPSLPPEPPRPSPRPRPFPPSTSSRPLPEVPNRRRGTGKADGVPVTGEQPSGPRPMATARPAVPPSKAAPPAAPPTVSTPIAPPSANGPSTGSSVAQILAQNGGGSATGSRRQHRRYREDDEADDVLARVLREN